MNGADLEHGLIPIKEMDGSERFYPEGPWTSLHSDGEVGGRGQKSQMPYSSPRRVWQQQRTPRSPVLGNSARRSAIVGSVGIGRWGPLVVCEGRKRGF